MSGDRPLAIGILCHPTYGGSGVVASELALRLAERGHRVHLFSYQVPPRLALAAGPVEMHVSHALPYPLFSSTPHDLALTSRILDVHRERPLDILHAHYALPHAVSAVLARAAAGACGSQTPRVITTLHGTDITLVGSDPSYSPLTRYAIGSSDGVTAVSRWLRSATLESFFPGGACAPPIAVVPNFVDTDRFRPPAEQTRRASDPLAVHVSNFRPVKRVPFVVEAFAAATRGTRAHLRLVGDGPDHACVRQRVRDLDVEDRVSFLGERDAIPELIAGADAFVLASEHESFGLSALEAMACGVAVVSTRVGGLPEVVDDGRTGLLADPDAPDALAEALRSLLFDRERARSLGRAARADACERFDERRIVPLYEDTYWRVLAAPERPT
jgi:N-acetyl-alpha-D-glucosaminyl L-malate synthase BshA